MLCEGEPILTAFPESDAAHLQVRSTLPVRRRDHETLGGTSATTSAGYATSKK